jgi:hypothetical protein
VRADTENPQAYELYLKARELFIARRDLPDSVRLFERVVELDPKFARGWEGLAAVSSIIGGWGIRDRDYTTLATQAANRALQLDPSLSMPWAALAMAESTQWPVDWARHLDLMDRALKADPKNATPYLWRSIAWLQLGFFDRAIADLDRCLELEPGYLNATRHKALALLLKGQADAAIELFQRGVAAGFVSSRAENFVGPLLARGDTLAALLLMDDVGVNPAVRDILVDALSKPDAPRVDARAVMERYLSDTEDRDLGPMGLTHPYLWLGEFDRVGASDDNLTTAIVTWDRYPPRFRNSAGFKRKVAANGVLAYWRKHGFPPQCRTVGKQDFTCD